ncbi:MAG TPA: zf-TFIIB domain-containing protein, partial [Acidobacteriota bacterium]|nr:zf-TFIIB domain-containing protein [Acidobacteriota bacterium]
LVAKAREFREKVVLNPLKKQKIGSDLGAAVACPSCGYRMVARPYNYQYFVPVDKCLSCSKIWFDADELEVLQVLIEDRKAK